MLSWSWALGLGHLDKLKMLNSMCENEVIKLNLSIYGQLIFYDYEGTRMCSKVAL